MHPIVRTAKIFTYVLFSFVIVLSNYETASAYLINKDYIERGITQFDERVSAEDGCSDIPQSTDSGSVDNINVGIEPKERRVNLIKLFMSTFNLTAQQAAGIIGNFAVEAGFYAADTGGGSVRPDINQGDQGAPTGSPPDSSSLGYGWAQWSGGRKTAFVRFLNDNPQWVNEGRATDMANIQYLKKELESSYRSTLPALRNTSTPNAAMRSFEATFERAGSPNYSERQRWAEQSYREYAASGGDSPTVTLDNPTGSTAECEDTGDGGEGGVGNATSARFDQVAFPLRTTQKEMLRLNPSISRGTFDNTHPNYTAYDIIAETGTEVLAFASGEVSYESTDRCPGKLLTIWNEEAQLGVTYMHLSSHIREGARVQAGDHVGVVGSAAQGCGIAHLHIDVATDRIRQACSRLSCSIASHFRSISTDLYNAYKQLPPQ